MVGCDSHTCTYGAINVFSTGVGSTDGAAAMASGKLWFKVPDTMKVTYDGELQPGVFSKDLILYLAGQIGVDGATYEALEFHGPVIDALSVEARMTISNMAIEVGAKAGLMKADDKTLAWFEGRGEKTPAPQHADADAVYARPNSTFDASAIGPQIAKPHAVDNVSPIEEVEGTPIAEGVLGTCTNGRLEDFAVAAKILEGRKVHPDVRFIVAPASRQILLDAIEAGYIQTLVEAGAALVTPGCGPCVGTHNGVPIRRRERHLDGEPQLQGPHGQQQRVHLPRQPGHRGRIGHRGQDHRPAQVLRRLDDRDGTRESRSMELKAKAFKYGDDINTDYIISGKYKFKSADMEAMAVHAMEELDPDYYDKVKPDGGFLVAGKNFGMGSSREQAPLVLIHSNTKAVIAKSFARIFYRNAINTGLPVIECDTDLIDDGDELVVDLEAGVVAQRDEGNRHPVPAAAARDGAAARRRRAGGALQEARRIQPLDRAPHRPQEEHRWPTKPHGLSRPTTTSPR